MQKDNYKRFFDMTCSKPVPSEIKDRILGPFARNAEARRGSLSFLVGCKPDMMLGATHKFPEFPAPVLLIWGEEDALFPVQLAEDLTTKFRDARLVKVPGASLFVSLDEPKRVADEIARFIVPPR